MAKSIFLSQVVENCVKDVGCRVDSRHIAFDVDYEVEKKGIRLRGFVHYPQQKWALVNSLSSIAQVQRKKIPIRSGLKILSKKKLRFAQVKVPFANIRFEPKRNGEVRTQAFLGSFVLCYFTRGRYWYCADPNGYLGYIHKNDLVQKTRKEYLAWLNGLRGRVLKDYREGALFLPVASELACADRERVVLPDGRKLRLPKSNLYTYEPAKNRKINSILKTARSFFGVPYHWGGKTSIGLDCSGFTQVVYALHHIALPRDAGQQVNVGRQVGMLGDFSDLLPGDLLFFMGSSSRIIHVGISSGGDRFLHAIIREGITESSIDDTDMGGSSFRDSYIMGRRILI